MHSEEAMNERSTFCRFKMAALMLVISLISATSLAAPMRVTIDTHNFGVSSGYLDMTLSATNGVPLVITSVSNVRGFSQNGVADSFGVTMNGGSFNFRNDAANDLLFAVNFGGVLSFDLDMLGEPDPLQRYMSRFLISAFDTQFLPLGNFDPITYGIVEFTWVPPVLQNEPGAVGKVVYDNAAVSVAAVEGTNIPEPKTLLLLLIGACLLLLVRRQNFSNRAVIYQGHTD
jgi:hypothetical protein